MKATMVKVDPKKQKVKSAVREAVGVFPYRHVRPRVMTTLTRGMMPQPT
jgi:hypothetical protein